MNAEIITVGTEILIGDILNTNQQYLSKRLAELGIFLYYHTTVGDNKSRLLAALNIAAKRSQLIILTGGLGPTPDDLTKETVAEFVNKKLILNQNAYKKISAYFKKINRKITAANKKQAYFPANSIILNNPNGTAPGCITEKDETTIMILPGPPREMIPMFENYAVKLQKKFSEKKLFIKQLRCIDEGESVIAEKIKEFLDSENPTVATYAKLDGVTIKIITAAKSATEAEKISAPVENEIRSRLGKIIYTDEEKNIETVVAELLITSKKTIALAESCTGGLITAKLVNYAGISNTLIESIVVYSNESKISRLKVSKKTLDTFGAVSVQTAAEMAEGICKTSDADIGLSVTGIAGPCGGSPEKPIGLVFFGLHHNGKTKTFERKFSGNRQTIRERAALTALDILRLELINSFK